MVGTALTNTHNMKKFLLFLTLLFSAGLNAQTPGTTAADSTAKPALRKLYHGINAGASIDRFLHRYYMFDRNRYAPTLGYYLDIHLNGRAWLFMQFNLNMFYIKTTSSYYTPLTGHGIYSGKKFYFDLDVPVRIAIRLGKKDAKFLCYPTAGLGLYIPLYYYEVNYINNKRDGVDKGYPEDFPFYPYVNAGFEMKWKYSPKHHIGLGFTVSYVPTTPMPSSATAYLKFGWNKYRKVRAAKN